MLYSYVYSVNPEKLVPEYKIVRKTRNVIVIDFGGKISTFKRVEQSPNKKLTAKPKPKRKSPVSNASALAALADTMPKCSVRLERLTKADIAAKIALIERNGKVNAVKAQIIRLPRKFFCECMRVE